MKAKRNREKNESKTTKEEITGREISGKTGRLTGHLVEVIKGTNAFYWHNRHDRIIRGQRTEQGRVCQLRMRNPTMKEQETPTVEFS